MRRPFRLVLPVALVAAALTLVSPILKGATLAPGAWTFPGVQAEWFGLAEDLDGDGNQELVLSTIDSSAVFALSPPTPVYIFAVNGTTIVDKSAAFFGTPPLTWETRTILAGDFNGDGQRDLYFCTAGREVTDRTTQTVPRTPGVWGEQDQVWFGKDGKFVDGTATLPQSVDYTHGCSGGDLDRSGRDSVVINDLNGTYAPYTAPSAVIHWSATQWLINYPFPVFTGTRTGKSFGFFTATGDFDKNGYADVVGDQEVLWGGPNGPQVRTLPLDHLQSDTTAWQGTAVADLNGDGYPDVVKVLSTKTTSLGLVGARYVLLTSDGHGNLAEKLDAFPGIDTYGQTEFGIAPTVIDINFDGFPDLVTFGNAYDSGTSLSTSPTAVWLNDGSGRFSLAHFSDPMVASSVCAGTKGAFRSAHFLKTANPKAYTLVLSGCYPGFPNVVYTSRTVTPAAPLAIGK